MNARPAIRTESFAIFLNEESDVFFLNSAIPIRMPEESDIDEMVRIFREHNRMPYLEIFQETWPELCARLDRKGFSIQAEYPTMICMKDELVAFSSGHLSTHLLTPDDDFTEYFAIGREAFGGGDFQVSKAHFARTKQQIRNGLLRCAVTSVDGNSAASACTTPFEGVCELAGVGTRRAFRRRGAARAVSSFLLEDHFKSGDLAWLSAGDDAAQSLYEKLGFRLAGTQVNYALK